MKTFRIDVENEFEADSLADLLEKEGIPHTVISHHSLAYDGLFQMTLGWGHVEIPIEHQEKATELWHKYREFLSE